MKMEKVIKILCFRIFRIYQYFLIIATLKSESKSREFSQMTCSLKVNLLDKAHLGPHPHKTTIRHPEALLYKS